MLSALRKNDIESIQIDLAENGLSSLGRLENSVLLSIEQVLKHFGYTPSDDPYLTKISYEDAHSILTNRSKLLLGTSPKERNTKIMATIDIDTAYQPQLLEELLKNGMDIARINCAYNATQEWKIIIDAIRNAENRLNQREQDLGKRCVMVMDLAGPKIRIGNMKLEYRPLKITVPKDINGNPLRVIEGFLDCEADYTEKIRLPGDNSSFIISVSANGKNQIGALNIGEKISFIDFRGRSRSMRVLERITESKVRVGIDKTIYLQEGIVLYHKFILDAPVSPLNDKYAISNTENGVNEKSNLVIGTIKPRPMEIKVNTSYKLLLYKGNIEGYLDNDNKTAVIGCTMPEILEKVKIGDRVLIDDGKIGSIVSSINKDYLELKITYPYNMPGIIKSNKGLNFPDSDLNLSAITHEDLENLKIITKYADAVAMSFVNSHNDISLLGKELLPLGCSDFGIIAKIETRNAVYNLSRIIIEGLTNSKFGILIARGDLAAEIGYENLSLIQEDILCICEAAHVPVILATQFLENLSKNGLPTRAEIIDASKGQRADCVMLNKGKYIIDAVKILSLLLKTEERNYIKKRQIFREFIEQYGIFGN